MNPYATILMNDLGLAVLEEWQRTLEEKDSPDVSFALFDATKMPLKSNSFDTASDLGGFVEIQESVKAIEEVYRILKPRGTLFSVDGTIERDDFSQLPEEVRTKWHKHNPPMFDGFLEAFSSIGFKLISNKVVAERELSPDEGGLPREANKHGVALHIKHYLTEVVKS